MNFKTFMQDVGIRAIIDKTRRRVKVKSINHEDTTATVVDIETGRESTHHYSELSMDNYGLGSLAKLFKIPQLKYSNYKGEDASFYMRVSRSKIKIPKLIFDLIKSIGTTSFDFGKSENGSIFIVPFSDNSGDIELKQEIEDDFSYFIDTLINPGVLEIVFEVNKRFSISSEFSPVLYVSIADITSDPNYVHPKVKEVTVDPLTGGVQLVERVVPSFEDALQEQEYNEEDYPPMEEDEN